MGQTDLIDSAVSATVEAYYDERLAEQVASRWGEFNLGLAALEVVRSMFRQSRLEVVRLMRQLNHLSESDGREKVRPDTSAPSLVAQVAAQVAHLVTRHHPDLSSRDIRSEADLIEQDFIDLRETFARIGQPSIADV